MKEYFGKSANVYQQTNGKKNLLIPAVLRSIPQSKNAKSTLLDIACGSGDFCPLILDKGYQYFGVDVSPEMLARAKAAYPSGSYIEASSSNFASKIKDKCEVVLISMLFPALKDKEDITQTLKECSKVLQKDGRIIIAVSHPNFDCYMRKGLFGLNWIETKFDGYFKSGRKFLIHKKFEDGREMVFEDYHWTFKDYFDCITEAGFKFVSIDECPPLGGSKEFQNERAKFPTYLVLVCK